eukprot:m51a1_g9428 putative hemolysin d (405) ;mRNA; f:396305-397931
MEDVYVGSCARYNVEPDPSIAAALRSGSSVLAASRRLGGTDVLPLADSRNTVRVRRLVLSGSPIGSMGAKVISEVLKHDSSLTDLDLSCCGIGPSGACALGRALLGNSSLSSLNLHGNTLDAPSAEALAASLCAKGSALRSLDVSDTAMGSRGVGILTSAVGKCNKQRPATPVECNSEANFVVEETLNAVSHGIGFVLAIAGAVAMLRAYWDTADTLKLVSSCVFVGSMATVYLSSCCYHSFFRFPRLVQVLHRLDHTSIYLLIAGTYTPFALVCLNGIIGWTLFWTVWAMGLFGIALTLISFTKFKVFKLCLYVSMGWTCVMIALPALTHPSLNFCREGVAWLAAGGISYTSGVYFYAKKSNPINHVWWHLFVLGGSVSHYVCIYNYVMPIDYPTPRVDNWYY